MIKVMLIEVKRLYILFLIYIIYLKELNIDLVLISWEKILLNWGNIIYFWLGMGLNFGY